MTGGSNELVGSVHDNRDVLDLQRVYYNLAVCKNNAIFFKTSKCCLRNIFMLQYFEKSS